MQTSRWGKEPIHRIDAKVQGKIPMGFQQSARRWREERAATLGGES